MSETTEREGREAFMWAVVVAILIGLASIAFAGTWLGFAKAVAWLAFWTFIGESDAPNPRRPSHD